MKKTETDALPSKVVLLLAIACGFAVANVYYAQPLLDTIGETFNLDQAKVGIIVTISQIGYGMGLLLLVPLIDLINERKLIVGQFLLLGIFLLFIGFSSSLMIVLIGMFLVGSMAVVTQTLVAYAANLATGSTQGSVVGKVTSGVVIGLLLARTVSGLIAQLAGWRMVYILSAMIIFIIGFFLYKALPVVEKRKKTVTYFQLVYSVFLLFTREPLLLMRSLVAMFIFAAGQVLWTPMVLPLSQEPFSFSHGIIGMFGLFGVMGVLGASKAGYFSDKGYSGWVSFISLLLMFISWFFTVFMFQSLGFLLAGIIIFDMGLQAVHVANQSIILKIFSEAPGRVIGGYMIFYSIGSAGGSIASTAVYANWGWTGVCILGAGISVMAILCWWYSLRYQTNALK